MKLKKIKLINWHIFTNNTIEVDGNILITGENASGKSTLMDAIYYVLSGGDQYHFNKAANEGGQRNLETYMRGKRGSEKNPYLRPQTDVVSYIVLEYEDEKRRHNMVLGCEMEIIAATQPKNHFFVINNYKIKDDDFIKDKQIIEYKSFKSNASNGTEIPVKSDGSIISSGLNISLKGKSELEIPKADYSDPGVTATYNGKDVTTSANITYEVNGNTYNSKSDLDTAINRLDTGKYSIKYIVTYRGETDNLIRTIIIK